MDIRNRSFTWPNSTQIAKRKSVNFLFWLWVWVHIRYPTWVWRWVDLDSESLLTLGRYLVLLVASHLNVNNQTNISPASSSFPCINFSRTTPLFSNFFSVSHSPLINCKSAKKVQIAWEREQMMYTHNKGKENKKLAWLMFFLLTSKNEATLILFDFIYSFLKWLSKVPSTFFCERKEFHLDSFFDFSTRFCVPGWVRLFNFVLNDLKI